MVSIDYAGVFLVSLDFSLQAQHTPEDRHIAYAGLQGVSCCIRAKDNQMLEHITSFFISQRCTIHLPQHGSAYINIFQKTECVLLFGMVIQRNGIIDSPLLRRLRLNRWLQQKFEVGLDDAVETLCIQLQNFLRTILQRKVFCDCKINIQV